MTRIPLVAAVVFSCVALAAGIARLHYGVDVTDECFTPAIAYRFHLGDRPFVDELNVVQLGALMVWPVVAIHHAVVGSADGLVLTIRVAFVALMLAVGTVVFRRLRPIVGGPAALLIASVCPLFAPFNIFSLGYNTLGCAFLTLGTFTLLGRLGGEEPGRIGAFAVAGAALALAALAYPPFAAPLVVLGAHVLARGRPRGRVTAAFMGGAALAVAPAAVLVLAAGPSAIGEVVSYSFGGEGDGASRAAVLVAGLKRAFPRPYLVVPVLAFLLALPSRMPRAAAALVPFVPVVVADAAPVDNFASMAFVVHLALLAPLIALGAPDRARLAPGMAGVWVPSLAGGALAALMSTNGGIAASVGLFPAFLVSMALLVRWTDAVVARAKWGALAPWFQLAPALVLVLFARFLYGPDTVYRDADVADLDVRIADGPFRGLWTNRAREELLRSVTADAVASAGSASRITFLYDFPAGTLLVGKPPAVGSPWVFRATGRNGADARLLRRHATGRNVVFRLKDDVVDTRRRLLDDAIAASHHVLVDRRRYTVLAEQPLPKDPGPK